MGEVEEQTQLQRMPAQEFVRRMRTEVDRPETHYAFWLGAGCSTSCGIPAAGALVSDRWLPRLRQVQGVTETDLDTWAEEVFTGYDSENPAALYGPVLERLFIQPDARQREIEELCDRRSPGFGYAVLASLLGREDRLFNAALTTNFDDLIVEAMYVFGEARPLVIPDDSLAAFIRPTRMRPLVVKVHGDYRLSPLNTAHETEKLKRGISESIGNFLHDRGLIFIGYGGNDVGIATFFKELPPNALPLGIWWASRSEPKGVLREWLGERNAVWVEIPGFDELMLLFKSEFAIPNPASDKFERIFGSYVSTYGELQKQVVQIPDSHPQASSLKGAAERADASATDWSAVYLRAARYEDEDPDRAEEIYKDGIAEFPRAALLPLGLSLLLMKRTRYAEALPWSKTAIELEPESPQAMLLRGYVLANAGELDEALEIIKQALDLNPHEIIGRAAYGSHLIASGRVEEAKGVFEQIDDPSAPDEFAAAAVLADDLGLHDLAQTFHEQALDGSTDTADRHANYVRCLIALGKTDEARDQAGLALEELPRAAVSTQLELAFYRVAIESGAERDAALSEIKSLVSAGSRLPIWNLDPVVEFCRRGEDPDVKWMEQLALVIKGRKAPDVLESWPRWQQAD